MTNTSVSGKGSKTTNGMAQFYSRGRRSGASIFEAVRIARVQKKFKVMLHEIAQYPDLDLFLSLCCRIPFLPSFRSRHELFSFCFVVL